MAVSSPRRALLAAVLLSFLLGAATGGRTVASHSSSQSLAEDKSRLGSTPPSCHNRCSACNPCTPVQVTTVPGPGRSGSRIADDAVAGFSRYSNYKPLGWKCRCAGRLYDP
ncbi:hypothetical protein ACP4OV_000910 [Aristida adscensionis]